MSYIYIAILVCHGDVVYSDCDTDNGIFRFPLLCRESSCHERVAG